ncbi:MAG: hypothetical protein DCC71_03140 [Proteobacteria bacterium]|nr:MAG: hypothetical protein DCC71_03140 [Pseudomonadota bacterium]
MDIYELLRQGQHRALARFDALLDASDDGPERRRELLAEMQSELFQHERAANSLYGALLRSGAEPGAILAAIESQSMVRQFLAEMERSAVDSNCWLGSVALLRRLVEEHFDEQEGAVLLAREHLAAGDVRMLAEMHACKRAAEESAGLRLDAAERGAGALRAADVG